MSTCIYIINPLTQERLPVDFSENDEFEVEYAATVLTDLNKPKSFLSKSLKLVGSKNTNKALQMLYRVDSDITRRSPNPDTNKLLRTFDVTEESLLGNQYLVQVITDGVDILRGVGILTVESVEVDLQRQYAEYDCSITGTRYNWILEIDGKNLCDLTDLGTVEYDEAVILNTQDRKGKLGTVYDYTYRNCAFYPVHYGWWGPTTNVNSAPFVPFGDLRPHIYVKSIVDTIFSQFTNYTVESSFFNSEFFTGLTMPYVEGGPRDLFFSDPDGEADSNVDTQIEQFEYDFTTLPVRKLRVQSNNIPNTSWNVLSHIYTPTTGGQYTLDMDITCEDPFPPPGAIRVELSIRDVATDTDQFAPLTIWTPAAGTTPVQTNIVQNVCLNANTEYYVALRYLGAPSSSFRVAFSNLGFNVLELILINATGLCTGSQVDLAGMLSCNVSLKSFLDELTTMFNLVWDTSPENNTIYVEPDSRVLNCEDFQDWTPYLDMTERVNQDLTVDSVKNAYFVYKKDENDPYLVDFNIEDQNRHYSGKLVFEASDSEFEEKPMSIFASSHFIRNFDVRGNGANSPVWLRMWNKKSFGQATSLDSTNDPVSKTYKFVPRIAYYYGLVDETEPGFDSPTATPVGPQTWYGYSYRDQFNVVTDYPYFPYAYMVDIFRKEGPSLAFSDDTYNDDVGLLTSYWSEYFNTVREGRTLSATFKLPTTVISKLNLFKPVFVAHDMLGYSLYRISRISGWSPITKKAKVELVKI